jgi:hypothetical protein
VWPILTALVQVRSLEVLRQLLNAQRARIVIISRVAGTLTFPVNFMFAIMNTCP